MPILTRHEVNLTGFTAAELTSLAHHLAYAAAARRREMNRRRNDRAGLRGGPFRVVRRAIKPVTAARYATPYLAPAPLLQLIREHRFTNHLAQAVTGAGPGSWRIDLSKVLNNGPGPFLDFLNGELYRARLAAAYIEATPFDRQTRRDLFLILDIEFRVFSRLLHHLKGHFSEEGRGHPERISLVPDPDYSSLFRR